jgi:mRNA interferase MazF
MQQGDIFWIELDAPSGSEPGYRHPHGVIQNNVFNRSRINTVVVGALTSNLRRATAPGNGLREPGEANLLRQSVVNVSQIFTVKRAMFYVEGTFRTPNAASNALASCKSGVSKPSVNQL